MCSSDCLRVAVKKQTTQLPDVVQKVLQQEMLPLIGDKDAASLNSEFLDRYKDSLPHRVAGNNVVQGRSLENIWGFRSILGIFLGFCNRNIFIDEGV